jgi:hypothetical protein
MLVASVEGAGSEVGWRDRFEAPPIRSALFEQRFGCMAA